MLQLQGIPHLYQCANKHTSEFRLQGKISKWEGKNRAIGADNLWSPEYLPIII